MIEPKTNNISKDKPQPDVDRSGDKTCSKCQKVFFSPDKTAVTRCSNCKRNESGCWMEANYGWTS